MSIGQRAKQATEQARQAATGAAAHARESATVAGGQVRDIAGTARRSLATVVERIDPSLLADVIVKATALQERTNAALRRKGSAYRIAEVTITATIPPQVGFSIARIGDIDDEVTGSELDSTEVLRIGRVGADAILSLDGETGAPAGEAPDDAESPAMSPASDELPLADEGTPVPRATAPEPRVRPPATSPTVPPALSPTVPPTAPPALPPALPAALPPALPRFGPLWGPEVAEAKPGGPPGRAEESDAEGAG